MCGVKCGEEEEKSFSFFLPLSFEELSSFEVDFSPLVVLSSALEHSIQKSLLKEKRPFSTLRKKVAFEGKKFVDDFSVERMLALFSEDRNLSR